MHVEFDTGSSKVKIEGPKEDVEKARERIAARAKELEDNMCVEEVDVPTKYHKHIIGKAGANINRSVRRRGGGEGMCPAGCYVGKSSIRVSHSR